MFIMLSRLCFLKSFSFLKIVRHSIHKKYAFLQRLRLPKIGGQNLSHPGHTVSLNVSDYLKVGVKICPTSVARLPSKSILPKNGGPDF